MDIPQVLIQRNGSSILFKLSQSCSNQTQYQSPYYHSHNTMNMTFMVNQYLSTLKTKKAYDNRIQSSQCTFRVVSKALIRSFTGWVLINVGLVKQHKIQFPGSSPCAVWVFPKFSQSPRAQITPE